MVGRGGWFDRNGPYTRAAWGIGISMAVVILLLVIFKSESLIYLLQ